MVSIVALLIPIVASAIAVFIASSVIHMVLTFHRKDVLPVPDQDAVQEALRPFALPPGDYMLPHGGSMAAMKDPAFLERLRRGPVVVMTVLPSGVPNMARPLTLWFLYCLLVSVFAAYVAGRALATGADYLAVFRFAGVTAFAGYALALMQQSIWWSRSWGTTVRSMLDGLIYALLTGGVFGWLWPR
jgi:hypothetical protein